MKSLSYFLVFLFIFVAACNKTKHDPTFYVDPFIGTDGHGHTFPGATLPNGMVQLSPDTRIINWDACSGYHSSDNSIIGFSHTHLSGTGAIDYGDIRLMPTTGEINLIPGNEEDTQSGYRSSFKHETEKAKPGYYSVKLEDYGILAELTATERVGIHRYQLSKGNTLNLILDLGEDLGRDKILDANLEWVNDTTVQGYRITEGWANEQHVYFYAIFSKPSHKEIIQEEKKSQARGIVDCFVFDLDTRELMVKVALSAVSTEGAKKNMEAEAPHWNFNQYRKEAKQKWNKRLQSISISGKNEENKTIFYTALYHSFIAPNLYSDVDGSYRGMDMQIHQADHPVYTVFSLWDTFRATHPLITLLDPKLSQDLIKTMILKYQESGLLPVWELAACETGCMIGYHSIPVITDAFVKGLNDFNVDEAYEAMKKSAFQNHLGLEYYQEEGYIPADKEHEAVAKTLEYAYDDWCIAMMAKALNKDDDYRLFIQRAQYYKNLFDHETLFMRAKKNGSWIEPFDPFEVSGHYTEANAWQYSYFVPQDISGFIELMGGDDSFDARLDSLFLAEDKITGREQPDISGMIGQYAHGNEPSHHMAYLYNFIGKPWKTQEIVHQIMTKLYTTQRDGLCGNEDCGQMSSWYNFTAAGFYPVTPGTDFYVLGTPLFDKIIFHLGDKDFTIKAKNLSQVNKYIRSATLNGQPLHRSYIFHHEIVNGGNLVFEMQAKPNLEWGQKIENRPKTSIDDYKIITTPVLKAHEKLFVGSSIIEFVEEDDFSIVYLLKGNSGSSEEKIYTGEAIVLNETTILNAFKIDKDGQKSKKLIAHFHQIPEGMDIELMNPYSHNYTAGGKLALLDGVRGNLDFRSNWQGFQKDDLIATIDLGSQKNISSLSITCLQDQRIWIMLPQYVEYFISNDRVNFESLGKVFHSEPAEKNGAFIHTFELEFPKQKTKYIKIEVKNFGILPEWHYGAGGDAWIFADELIIR